MLPLKRPSAQLGRRGTGAPSAPDRSWVAIMRRRQRVGPYGGVANAWFGCSNEAHRLDWSCRYRGSVSSTTRPSGRTKAGDRRPPNPPWHEFPEEGSGEGYLSYYLADELARFPVRGVTRVGDNKSDPNLETLTYGLFTTCEPAMRLSIVRRGIRDLFFLTRPRGQKRALVGHYRLRWYCEGSFAPRRADYALTAESCRFIDPIPVDSVKGELGACLQHRFRLYMRINEERNRELLELIYRKPNRTDRYVAEVERLERLNASYTGYRYPTWKRTSGWSWADAPTYLDPEPGEAAEVARNTSPSGRWICASCRKHTVSAALLKACPQCGRIGTLKQLAKK